MMFNKVLFVTRNKLMNLSTYDLLFKVMDSNILISTLAKEELINRDLNDLNTLPDAIIEKVIEKLNIEQIWTLIKSGEKNHFVELAIVKLNKILDYYQNLNKIELQNKINNDNKKIYVLK